MAWGRLSPSVECQIVDVDEDLLASLAPPHHPLLLKEQPTEQFTECMRRFIPQQFLILDVFASLMMTYVV